MTDEDDKVTSETPTLLESIPRTEPSILQSMQDAKISAAHCSAIGQIAARWAYFEAVLDLWLWTFNNRPAYISVCFTSQMTGPRAKIDAFIALVKALGADKKWNEKLEKFAKNTTGLSEQRNRAVHDVWDLSEPSRPIRSESTARRSVRLIEIHVPTQELIDLVGKIQALSDEFDAIAHGIFSELISTPGKWPPDTTSPRQYFSRARVTARCIPGVRDFASSFFFAMPLTIPALLLALAPAGPAEWGGKNARAPN